MQHEQLLGGAITVRRHATRKRSAHALASLPCVVHMPASLWRLVGSLSGLHLTVNTQQRCYHAPEAAG